MIQYNVRTLLNVERLTNSSILKNYWYHIAHARMILAGSKMTDMLTHNFLIFHLFSNQILDTRVDF
jgi:hypothetical protein